MDPDALLAVLLDAFRDGDREVAWEALENLYAWLTKGGFMPADPRTPESMLLRNEESRSPQMLREIMSALIEPADGTPAPIPIGPFEVQLFVGGKWLLVLGPPIATLAEAIAEAERMTEAQPHNAFRATIQTPSGSNQ